MHFPPVFAIFDDGRLFSDGIGLFAELFSNVLLADVQALILRIMTIVDLLVEIRC